MTASPVLQQILARIANPSQATLRGDKNNALKNQGADKADQNLFAAFLQHVKQNQSPKNITAESPSDKSMAVSQHEPNAKDADGLAPVRKTIEAVKETLEIKIKNTTDPTEKTQLETALEQLNGMMLKLEMTPEQLSTISWPTPDQLKDFPPETTLKEAILSTISPDQLQEAEKALQSLPVEVLNQPLERFSKAALKGVLANLEQSKPLSSPALKSLALTSPQIQAQIQAIVDKLPPDARLALEQTLQQLQNHVVALKTSLEEMPKQLLPKSVEQLQFEFKQDKPLTKLSDAEKVATPSISEKKTHSFADVLAALPHETTATEPEKMILPESLLPSVDAATLDDSSSPLSAFGTETLANATVTPSSAKDVPAFSVPIKPNVPIPSPQQQMVEGVKFAMAQGKRELVVQLHPDELGDVKLVLTQSVHSGLTAKLITGTADAKNVLEKHLHDLTRSLEQNGLSLAKVSVVQAGEQTADARNEFSQQSQSQQNQTAFFQTANGNNGSSQQQSSQGYTHQTVSNPFDTGLSYEAEELTLDASPDGTSQIAASGIDIKA